MFYLDVSERIRVTVCWEISLTYLFIICLRAVIKILLLITYIYESELKRQSIPSGTLK